MSRRRSAGALCGSLAALANAVAILAVAGGAFTAAEPASAAPPPDITIGFENLGEGTALSSQYSGSGVTFSGTPTVVGPNYAHAGSRAAAATVPGGCELTPARTITIGFAQPHLRVSLYLSSGEDDNRGTVTVTARNAAGGLVGDPVTVTALGGPANHQVQVSAPTPAITSLTLESKTSCRSLYFDDLTFDAPTTTLTVAVSGNGRVTGSGIDCPGDCTEVFGVGFQVTLTAAPGTGASFGGWSQDCASAGTATTCGLTMDVDRSATATFGATPVNRVLTVSVTGAGRVTGPGIDCPTDCTEQYAAGTTVQLATAAPAGTTLASWGGDCVSSGSAPTCVVVMDQNRSVAATFADLPPATRLLTVSVTGSGKVTGPGIDCPTDCTEQYPAGTSVQLAASTTGGTTFAGWGADCASAGTAGSCSLTMDLNKSVSATFAQIPAAHRLLTVSVTGSGKVTGPGIDCPSDCTEEFPAGSVVKLEAVPGSGSSLLWGGDCAAAGSTTTCSLTLSDNRSALAAFSGGSVAVVTVSGTPSLGPLKDPLPPIPEPAVETVVINVKRSGTVTSSAAREPASAGGLRRINCGVGGFDCYGEYRPGQALLLRARPAPGYVFERWSGACSGAVPTCRVIASNARSVTAVFAPHAGRIAVDAALRRPQLKVRWQGSIGAGRLVVQGWTSVPARVRVDMRRPGGGPLATLRLPVSGGAFRQTLPLRRGALSGGARVFPGGFTVALTGRSGKLRLPLQLQTIAIPSPRDGVVRKAFVSARQSGRAVQRLPKGATEAWANFRFETQPLATRTLTVSWYWPDGRLVGTVRKSNRPVISSYLRLGTGLPSGLWRAELRSRGRVVQRLAVRVG
jgi:hypothetical protein